MRIFDGVTVNPNNLSPTWQGAFGVAMLLANTLAEADKERKQRMTRQRAQATTLEEVMEQSGLDIPKLEVALTQFMGGTPEAQEAASYIVKTPDPVKLLHLFAQTYTEACSASGPIVTPPPAARPRAPQFRPEFTREGMEAAANAAPRPRSKLPTFRPEFTREGMAAQAASAAPATAPTSAQPTTPSSASASPPAPATASPGAVSSATSPTKPSMTVEPPVPAARAARPSSLSEALARRLAARDRRIEGYQAELETRVRCVEAELAMLREEVQELHRGNDCPVLFLVPSAEPLPPPASADPAQPETLTAGESTAESRPDEAPARPEPTAAEGQAAAEVKQAATTADAAESAPAEPPPAVTESEPELSEAVAAPPYPNEAPASPGPETATCASSAPAAEVPTPVSDSIAPAEAGGESDGTPPPPDQVPADEEPLPPPGSEADLVLAVEMLDEFSERTEAHYKTQIDQVKAMEGEVKLLRALVAREREARRVVSHG